MQYLKCDAPDCDHVEAIPDLTADLIGKPCPKCGASLLTEEDYRAGVEAFEAFKALEALGLMRPATPEDLADPENAGRTIDINPHAGRVNITIE